MEYVAGQVRLVIFTPPPPAAATPGRGGCDAPRAPCGEEEEVRGALELASALHVMSLDET